MKNLRDAWKAEEPASSRALIQLLDLYPDDPSLVPNLGCFPVVPVMRARGFVFNNRNNTFYRAIHELLRNAHLVKICKNPECPESRRYFIANTAKRKVCGHEACQTWAGHQSQNNYWHRRGKALRKRRREAG